MTHRSPTRVLSVLGLALGGVVAGHSLTYFLLRPSEASRAELLAQTGHAYLHTLTGLVLTGAAVALVAFVIGRLVEGRATGRSLARDLITLQVAAFVGMEAAERLAAGAPLNDLVRILPLGVAVQVAIALALGALLHRLLRGLVVVMEAAPTGPTFDRSGARQLVVVPLNWSGSAQIPRTRGRGPPFPR